MKTTLPIGREHSALRHLVILFTKTFQTLLLASGLLIVFSVQANAQAQTEPEYIQNWTALPEAEFHFDTAFALVKCSPDSAPVIFLEVFNEGGNVNNISFELIIGDKDRNTATVEIPSFQIAPSKYIRPKCGDAGTDFLKIAAPEGIDANSMFIYKIKYIK